MKSLKICFILAFVLAIGSAFISRPSSSKLVTFGWGKFNGICEVLPINGSFNCNVVPVGFVCSVTKGMSTTTAYADQDFCLDGNTIGVLRRN